MSWTLKKANRPVSDQISTSDAKCLCGKRVQIVLGELVKPHRPNANGRDNRKSRKASWCPIPGIISAALVAGNISGEPWISISE